MKTRSLLTIGSTLLALASLAPAQTTIRIVGSNGDRVATQTAISKLLASGWKYQGLNGNTTSAGSLSTATGSNFGAWNGTYNGNAVIIKTSFSGALAGIAAVAGKVQSRFVVSNGTGTGAVPNPLTGTVLNTDYELGTADFGFSTNFQATSPFNGVYNGVSYSPLIEEVVGVSPLGFYASPGFPASAANITTQQAQLLYTTGSLSLAHFTANFTADVNKIVYALGRNTDAGQRYGAYTEIGLGTSAAVKVWKPTVSGATTASGLTYGGSVTSQTPWPEETVSGVTSPVGGGGYSSGALIAAALTTTLSANAYKGAYLDEQNNTQYLYPDATAGYYIGYATPGDAANGILGGNGVVPLANRGVALKFNGVELTNANVQNGTYTAWLYNRILKPQSGLTGTKLTFANALRDQIKNTDATAGGGLFYDSNFKVQRFTDGGLVVPR